MSNSFSVDTRNRWINDVLRLQNHPPIY